MYPASRVGVVQSVCTKERTGREDRAGCALQGCVSVRGHLLGYRPVKSVADRLTPLSTRIHLGYDRKVCVCVRVSCVFLLDRSLSGFSLWFAERRGWSRQRCET